MNLFHTENRFLNNALNCDIAGVEKALSENACYESKEFEALKQSSIIFLQNNLN